MKKLLLTFGLAMLAVTSPAAYRQNPITTNTPAGMTNVIVAISPAASANAITNNHSVAVALKASLAVGASGTNVMSDDGSAISGLKATNAVMLDRYNVKWWGAVGDEATDDSAAFQAALDAATNATPALSSGEVYVPPGRYRLDSQIVIPDNVILRGSGWDTSIIMWTNAGVGVSMHANSGMENIGTRGFSYWTGVVRDSLPGNILIQPADQSAHMRVKSCRFNGFDTAVYLDYAWVFNFEDCVWYRCNTAILATNGAINALTVEGGEFLSCTNGFLLQNGGADNCTSVTLRGMTIQLCDRVFYADPAFAVKLRDVTIEDNYIENDETFPNVIQIYLTNVLGGSIRGNSFVGSATSTNVYLQGCYAVSFSENTVLWTATSIAQDALCYGCDIIGNRDAFFTEARVLGNNLTMLNLNPTTPASSVYKLPNWFSSGTNSFTQGGSSVNGIASTNSSLVIPGNVSVGQSSAASISGIDDLGDLKFGASNGYSRLWGRQETPRAKPSALLVGVDYSDENHVNIGGGSADGYIMKKIRFHTATNDTTSGNQIRMLIDTNGYVGIGTVAPVSELEVDGTVTATTFSGSGASLTGIGTNAFAGVPSQQALLVVNDALPTWTNSLTGFTISNALFQSSMFEYASGLAMFDASSNIVEATIEVLTNLLGSAPILTNAINTSGALVAGIVSSTSNHVNDSFTVGGNDEFYVATSGALVSSASITAAGFKDSTLTSAFVFADADGDFVETVDGSTLTNLTYLVRTNALNTGVITVGQTMITNLSGNITLGGFSGLTSAYENFAAILAIADGTTRTVTLPANVFSTDGAETYYVTNACARKFQFSIIPGVWTNCACVPSW